MTTRTVNALTQDLLILEAQKRVYNFEKANLLKRIFLIIQGEKPSQIEYGICLSNPMSEEFYKVFPFHKIKNRMSRPQ